MISWAITVCNELEEVKRLISQISQEAYKDGDEIVVLYDSQDGSSEVKDYLESINIKIISQSLNNNFAEFKNYLKQNCIKKYIFFIDADEYLAEELAKNIHRILEENDIDAIAVPRVNTVEGLTEEDIKTWGWRVNAKGWVNWADYQLRICRNIPEIRWEGKVHERLVGYKTIAQLPDDDESYTLIHPKDIKRQRLQNERYSKI